MFSFGNKVEAERRDTLIVLSDNQTAAIATVHDQDAVSVHAASIDQEYTIPLSDLKSYVGETGIIYVYKAPEENVEEVRRLAALEKSIVLKQITHFQERTIEENKKISIKEILTYVVGFILLLAVIFK